MRFVSLESGSSGNCTYIGTRDTHILVDAGISCRKIDRGLESLDLKTSELSAILVTHEHSDHIAGLKTVSKKYHIPIYSARETLQAIHRLDAKGEIDPSLFHEVIPDQVNLIGDLRITPFHISHDAANPLGYRCTDGRTNAAVCTDLGSWSEYTLRWLRDLDVVLLESNHDVRMLESGPYPYPLKRRIMGVRGHLSNEDSGQLLCEILNDRMKHVFLGHLSEINNFPGLASETVRDEIDESPVPYHSDDFPITVAPRSGMSEVVDL